MTEKLKPCPFCGGEASVKYAALVSGFPCGYWVGCDNGDCHENIECSTYAFDTEAEAIEAWNRRDGKMYRIDFTNCNVYEEEWRMNLEDFFITEYEKLKDENEKLKLRVAELSKPKGGAGLLDARVVDTEVEAVKTTTASSYVLRAYCFKGKPSSYIEEKKADIDNVENWCSGGYERPFAISRKTFAMLIEVKTIGKVCRFLADNDCKLEELGDMEQGEWCLAEQEAELVEDAKKVLLEEMDDVIKRLKDKEAEKASDD